MNANKMKALQDAENAFNNTIHGSNQEKEALAKWRNLCETEEEEQIAISAYLRRKREAKVAEKKAARRNKQTSQKVVQHERTSKSDAPPKTGKRPGKKRVRPPWWENF